jgi:hypothetical protein
MGTGSLGGRVDGIVFLMGSLGGVGGTGRGKGGWGFAWNNLQNELRSYIDENQLEKSGYVEYSTYLSIKSKSKFVA